MTNQVPFCERCGRPGPTLSGFHPREDGLVRWTLFRCGHMRTEVDDVATSVPSSEQKVAS